MILIFLIVAAWVGYAFWFVYDTRNDDFPPGGRAWWTPIFMFFVGVVAGAMMLAEYAKCAWLRARAHVRGNKP